MEMRRIGEVSSVPRELRIMKEKFLVTFNERHRTCALKKCVIIKFSHLRRKKKNYALVV